MIGLLLRFAWWLTAESLRCSVFGHREVVTEYYLHPITIFDISTGHSRRDIVPIPVVWTCARRGCRWRREKSAR